MNEIIEKADLLIKVAAKKARLLLEDAAKDARLLLEDAAKEAEVILIKVASEAAKEAASKEQREAAREAAREAVDTTFIIDSLGIGIWKWDLITNSLEWDRNMYRLYGADPSDFSGAYDAWENSLSADTKVKAVEEINNAVAGGKSFDTTFQVVQRNTGKIQEIRTRAFIIRDENGKPLKMWGINIDRTREAELEIELKNEQIRSFHNLKLAAASEAASEAAAIVQDLADRKIKFLDIAAHELRNPIASISLMIQLCEKRIEKGQPLPLDVLARLRAPVDRLARLVVDLVEMSRLERGLLSLLPVKTDLASLISECVEEFKQRAPEHRFIFNKPDQTVEINLDPIRIGQVLVNFLDNAVKYDGNGDIQVMLEVMPSVVRVSVTDYGLGISEDEQSLLFTAFARGSSNATIRAGGLGLGLSICKGIMDLHKGAIGVRSKVGHGSTFYFDLPRGEGVL